MIGKILAFSFLGLLFIGLGLDGTVSGLVKGYHNIESNPVLQNFSAYSVHEFKQGFSTNSTNGLISEIRSNLK